MYTYVVDLQKGSENPGLPRTKLSGACEEEVTAVVAGGDDDTPISADRGKNLMKIFGEIKVKKAREKRRTAESAGKVVVMEFTDFAVSG